MNELKNNTGAPTSEDLAQRSEELAREAEALGARIEERYYIPLAEQAEGLSREDRDLEAGIDRELKSMRDAAHSLSQAFAAVSFTADELRARSRDTRRPTGPSIWRSSGGAILPRA